MPPIRVTMWKCPHCHHLWKTKAMAKKCESLGEPLFRVDFKEGVKLEDRKHQEILVIKKQIISRSKNGKHLARYQITYGSINKLVSEKWLQKRLDSKRFRLMK